MTEQAKRFNQDKNRIGLVPPSLIEEVGKVMTFGAKKYEPNNWKKGMDWSKCIDSADRHWLDFKRGIDNDEESGLKHLSHLATNIAFLIEYYKIYPQGDDRHHSWLNTRRIGIDIDDVLAGWLDSFCEINKMEKPTSWQFHRDLTGAFAKMKESGIDLDEWMENLPVITRPEDIPFEPVAYITARSHCPKECAERWLDKHGFPAAPVYQTYGKSKVDICKELELDIFIDDNYSNFVELNNAGICTYLYDAPHNQRYNVGARRIYSLKELV